MILSLVTSALQQESKPGSLYYRHPEYTVRWWWREFNRISYLGGREYSRPARLTVEFDYPLALTRNADGSTPLDANGRVPDPALAPTAKYPSMLYRHNREKLWEYENRRRRAHYHNIVGTTINSLVSHALKQGVTRDGDDEMISFWNAVDCERKQSMDAFMRDGVRMAQVEGLMWCFADIDSTPAGDGKPYVYWVNPLDIFDWSIDEDGELIWIKQFVYLEKQRKPLEAITPVHRFRIWYADHVDEYDCDPTSGTQQTERPTKSTPHAFGRVPAEPLYAKKNNESAFPDGEPLASDLAKSANAIYNYTSLLDEILYKQTFSILCVPDKNVDAMQVGTNTVLGYNSMTAGALPIYVSPDAAQATVMMEAITGELSRARQAFGIGQPTDGSKQKSSAAAMELENEDKRAILADIASAASDFENRLVDMLFDMRTGAASDDASDGTTVQYPTEFDVQAFQDEVAEVLSLRAVGMSPEIMLELRRQLAARKLSGMPETERQELLDTLTVANGAAATPPTSGNPTDAVDDPFPKDASPTGGGGAKPGDQAPSKPAPGAPAPKSADPPAPAAK